MKQKSKMPQLGEAVLGAKKKTMIGMLMIPKTMAYMWIIGIALGIVF